MKLIDVSTRTYQAVYAEVDDEDFEFLNQWKWSAEKRSATFYAIRSLRKPDGKKTTIRMHQQVLGIDGSLDIDHADGNGLNNQRKNLRPCSVAQNQQNRRVTRKTSVFKGVQWDKSHGCWKSHVVVNGKRLALGSFKTEEAAARRYDQAAKAHFGEFARLNFPGDCCEAIPASVVPRSPKSLPRGVHLRPSGKFAANKRVHGRNYYLGLFGTADDASRAYMEFHP